MGPKMSRVWVQLLSFERLAVDAGFEPADDRVKVCCLTAWLIHIKDGGIERVHVYTTKASEDRASIM